MDVEACGYAYDDDFFTYIEEGARQSAQVIVPLMANLLDVGSVLDVGCGRGVWLREWRNLGVNDIVGVDGAYVDDAQLAISADKFVKCDLSQPLRLKRRFDLVQSLEVGEHVAAARADVFVANLTAHGDTILFSAAVPGQGGEFHVNEQPYAYWRDKFAAQGFRTFDWLRPRIRRATDVEPWYRYNALLFVRDAALDRARLDLLETEIPHDHAVPIWAPLSWRVRNSVLARLPEASVHHLAILKHKLILMRRRRHVSSYLH
jgi:SAM-dependent methyltransferase